MIENFVIPINKDELSQTRSGQYFVEKLVPIRLLSQALDEARTAFQYNGVNFIFKHFDTFFSLIVYGNKIELPIIMRGFIRIQKAIETLVLDLESIFERGNELEEEDRLKFLNINKMLGYLFSGLICHINDEISKDVNDKCIGKRKKSVKSDIEEEWEISREKVLEYIYRLLQLPLQKLWQPPILEDSFITLFTKVCYKILEQCKDSKQKYIRQTIFEILGTSVKKYNHGISCVIRIIQLVKLHDVLAAYIAVGVIQMINSCGCNGLIREIIKEIGESELSEPDSRNISIFLENIATTEPKIIIPILDDVMDYLASEHYTMRNCTITIIREVVQKTLTGDDLTQEQKDQRDECLNSLEEHILDNNAYVRSKVLQVWQHLCCEGAIPLARQGRLLAATALRLEDKSAIVRKQALQLMRALLQGNPFAAKLNKIEISKSLEKEEIKLRELQTESVSKSARGDNQRLELWNTFLPEIRKALKKVINDRGNKDKEQDNETEVEDINVDIAFEHVRHLMLKEKILEAVTYLWKVCIKLKQSPDIENLSPEAKEECLFLLLLKTFMESENNTSNENESTNKKQLTDKKNNEIEEIIAIKRVVNYLKNCLEFATELEIAIPMAEKLLFSTTASDAIEACALLGIAYQFGVAGAADAIRDALFQVFHRDQSVRNNIAMVYKDLYLNKNENQKSKRQETLQCVKSLIDLLKGLQPGQSQALTQLISTWYNNDDINNEILQVLWEKFSMKSSDTDSLDSRTALMLITMIAQAQDGIITGNLEVLIKVGLGPRAKTDLLLARDTCRALLTVKHKNDDIEKSFIRYPNDHEMFKEILALLIENFTNLKEDGYISFATDAINAIYHLANQPDHLIKQLLLEVYIQGQFNSNSSEHTVSSFLLSKLLYLIGHIAIKEMAHLDTSVYKELKRRDIIRNLKKGKNSDKNEQNLNMSRKSNAVTTPNSARQIIRNKETSIIMEDNGEEAVEGAAEDADAEFINDILENHIVTGDGLLVQFIPLVLDVCQYHDKYNNEDIQAAGALALSKMMTVSSNFCEKSLQLLITILERSPYPGIRANVLIGISDLTTRFPNQIEPWIKHVYGRLKDEDINVRSTCIRVLSSLILREMVRVRGQISELALCIVDKDTQIRQDAKQFFKALSQKGNALYNVMPDILSRLTDPDLDISESDFQKILKYILNLLQKEKQVDAIIDKICTRFKLATTERQWRDFAYCLSLLQFSAKSIRHLIECLPLLKEKIHHKQVLKALQSVIDQTKKKVNTKAACIELEEKIEELLKGREDTNQNSNEVMPPPPAPKSRKRSRRTKHRSSSEEEDGNIDSDSEPIPVTKTRSSKISKSRESKSSSSSDSDTDVPLKTPKRQPKINTSTRSVIRSSRKKRIDSVAITPSSLPKGNEKHSISVRSSERSSARLYQLRAKN
ncbi:PREDICTED: condensin complex subunit 1 [Eufriesea mexicana]|uniref:condensin complex subunit 1 n=1 Tax=Eufriesea mexicana TaxID=516756 RepID=UPI00083C79D2|nr:PREDICTED: condensin complex subunit 1 [Eufriesea mexicana]